MNASSREQFNELYRAYGRLVRNFLFRLGARANLDDLTQETFLRAWKYREDLREPAAAKAWLLRIALHRFYDQGRKKSHPTSPLEESEIAGTEASAARADARIDAERALEELPLEQRSVCLLFYLEDLSVAEIAEIVGVPEGTVKTRLLKAREKMKLVFENEPKKERV
jgi:RNA polymerase sigma-70 factor (ECF subfamily)